MIVFVLFIISLSAVQALLDGAELPRASAEKLFDAVAASLLCSHLEVEVAGLRVGVHIPTDITDPSLTESAATPQTQWALQKCRCLLKLMSSNLSVTHIPHSTFHRDKNFLQFSIGLRHRPRSMENPLHPTQASRVNGPDLSLERLAEC